MSVANGTPSNFRGVLDANYITNIALPTAGSTANGNGLDLVQPTPYPVTERVVAQIVTTAGNGANNKNITFYLQDSANNSTFANIAGLGTQIQTDANNGGYAASTMNWSLPPATRRYVRAVGVSQDANSGNAANGTMSFRIVF